MNAAEFVRKNKQNFLKNLTDKKIYIVCNQKEKTLVKNDFKCSLSSEFLSLNELEEIFSMAHDLNLNFSVFYSEEEFISFILSNKSELNLDKILVYNSAQSGSGAGRKCLVPAFCNLFKIKVTGSDTYRVGLCRNKYHTNKLLDSIGVSVPKSWCYYNGWLAGEEARNVSKIILKPIYESASIGISSRDVMPLADLRETRLQTKSKEMRQPILVQEFISGYEFELPILVYKNEVYFFELVNITTNNLQKKMGEQILDYDKVYSDKYFFGNSDWLQSDILIKAKQLADQTVKFLGLNGLCRIDFRLNEKNELFITDIATNPHFVSHSSISFEIRNQGLDSSDALLIILNSLGE